MTDNRNTILAVILSGFVLIAWQYFYNAPQMEKQRAQQTQAELARPAPQPTPGSAPRGRPRAAPRGGGGRWGPAPPPMVRRPRPRPSSAARPRLPPIPASRS